MCAAAVGELILRMHAQFNWSCQADGIVELHRLQALLAETQVALQALNCTPFASSESDFTRLSIREARDAALKERDAVMTEQKA